MLNTSNCSSESKPGIDPVVETIAQTIYDKAGKNIFAIDIRNTSSLCDYCIIAEGTVDRHVKAIAQTLQKELSTQGHKSVKVDGMQEGQWVILDFLNVMVHVLTPTFREKYRLERLWEEGTIIDLNLDE